MRYCSLRFYFSLMSFMRFIAPEIKNMKTSDCPWRRVTRSNNSCQFYWRKQRARNSCRGRPAERLSWDAIFCGNTQGVSLDSAFKQQYEWMHKRGPDGNTATKRVATHQSVGTTRCISRDNNTCADCECVLFLTMILLQFSVLCTSSYVLLSMNRHVSNCSL